MASLNKTDIYNILEKRYFIKTKKELLDYLDKTSNIFYKFSKNIKFNENNLGKYNREILWNLGHVVFFYSNLILKNLNNCKNIDNIKNYNKYIEFYDSFKTNYKYRDGLLLLNLNLCINYYKKIINILQEYIIENKIRNIESYIIMLGILHNVMHNEALIFTNFYLNNSINKKLINLISLYDNKNKLETDIIFIKYKKNTFKQGIDDDINYLIFDNESIAFETQIESFEISKYTITEYQYLQFILNKGYTNKKLWSENGFKWLIENNIKLPMFWYYDKKNKIYFKKLNGNRYNIETNLPIIHISYYEAEAYCKWIGGRLPKEKEYEYIATNKGKTKFPWGNIPPNNNQCNINYINYIQEVGSFKKGNNENGISQLIGNIWEWCNESIYPYNNFKIDPIYREMSYPFFGYKKICKGGCFCVPDYLIHPKYRNSQYPDCRKQFIGFRICKDI